MHKRIIMGIAVSFVMMMCIPSIIAEQETVSTKTNLIALGYIRINEKTDFINGFVIAGMNGDDVLTFEFVHIQFDGGRIDFFKPLPFIWWLQYTPAM